MAGKSKKHPVPQPRLPRNRGEGADGQLEGEEAEEDVAREVARSGASADQERRRCRCTRGSAARASYLSGLHALSLARLDPRDACRGSEDARAPVVPPDAEARPLSLTSWHKSPICGSVTASDWTTRFAPCGVFPFTVRRRRAEGVAHMVSRPPLTSPASVVGACWGARQFDETSGDDVVGVDPDPFHGLDPRRLVSLCPSFDFGLGIAFARTYVTSFARCEP